MKLEIVMHDVGWSDQSFIWRHWQWRDYLWRVHQTPHAFLMVRHKTRLISERETGRALCACARHIIIGRLLILLGPRGPQTATTTTTAVTAPFLNPLNLSWGTPRLIGKLELSVRTVMYLLRLTSTSMFTVTQFHLH